MDTTTDRLSSLNDLELSILLDLAKDAVSKRTYALVPESQEALNNVYAMLRRERNAR